MPPKKVMKLHLKKPAKAGGSSGLSVLDTKPHKEMSLEDKMAAFQKRGNQDVQVFLDSLTKHQREALRQRFSSARQSLKDKDADQLIEM